MSNKTVSICTLLLKLKYVACLELWLFSGVCNINLCLVFVGQRGYAAKIFEITIFDLEKGFTQHTHTV